MQDLNGMIEVEEGGGKQGVRSQSISQGAGSEKRREIETSKGNRSSLGRVADGAELRLEGRSSDEEAVDVGLLGWER